jgi:hypothetical protein
MLESELQSLIRDRIGLRIGTQMSQYVLRKTAESNRPVAIIGDDARTGIPRREMFDPQLLKEARST